MKKKNLSDIIVPLNSTIRSIIETISNTGTRGVFICDKNRELMGIVMDSDIRRAVLSNLDLNASVKTIMKTTPFVIVDDIPLEMRKQLFIKSEKMLVPIVDKKRSVIDYIYLPDILEDLFNKQTSGSFIGNGMILPPQKILVIGGAGYIGSVLVEKLLRKGYKVRVLDLLLYGENPICNFEGENLEFIRGDCRNEETIKQVLDGVDAVVHLGEIVGDPACSINESFTIETNYLATHRIVEQCMKNQINRLIFASSCSVYGQNDHEINEESELNPVSLYARCKIESEKAILSYGSNNFCPTILRLATVHGKSYRQRFDLVVNLLTIKALAEKKIKIFGGVQWRPFISVKDVCEGIIQVLHTDREKVKNQVFNLGDSRENYQLSQIGMIIKNILPEVEIEYLKDQIDKRNYRVSFEKIRKHLGFSVEYKLADTIKDFVTAYRQENLFHDYNDSKYHNYLSLSRI